MDYRSLGRTGVQAREPYLRWAESPRFRVSLHPGTGGAIEGVRCRLHQASESTRPNQCVVILSLSKDGDACPMTYDRVAVIEDRLHSPWRAVRCRRPIKREQVATPPVVRRD